MTYIKVIDTISLKIRLYPVYYSILPFTLIEFEFSDIPVQTLLFLDREKPSSVR